MRSRGRKITDAVRGMMQEEAQQQHKRAKKGRREVEGESEVRPVFIRGPRCKLVVRVSNLTLYTPNSRGGGKLHIVLE